MEVNVRCEVELTVGTDDCNDNNNRNNNKTEVLRLVLPCDVTHETIGTDDVDVEEEFSPADPFRTTFLGGNERKTDVVRTWEKDFGSDPVLSKDVTGDLNLLGLFLTNYS